jgi:xanthine dehydrogenase accessory factor
MDPLAAAADLRARGTPFVMATVVRAVAPTSAKPGDKALLTGDGLVLGWIGGRCAEQIVRKEAAAALKDGECRLIQITPNDEPPTSRSGLIVRTMECYSGGELEIYLEPFLQRPRLLVFGNSPVARALCDLGRVMKYDVTVVDLGKRPPMGSDIDPVRNLENLPVSDPSATFAVVSSHGVFDESSLQKAVALGLPYVGLVTSRRRREQVLSSLSAKGVPDDLLARISAPAGLDLGAREPEEIALAVMAQIVAVRRGASGVASIEQALHVGSEPANLAAVAPKKEHGSCHGRSAAGE